MVWLLPHGDSRPEATRCWWAPLLAGYLAAGRGLVTEDLDACLLWRFSDEVLPDPPGQRPMGEVVSELVGTERLAEVGAALGVFRRLRPEEPHVYVHVVAARPERQGRGLGARLLAALAGGPAGARPQVLESTNPRNHPFYLRNGFGIVAQATVPGTDITATALLRAGRPALAG
jgi:GNAT superfamily N-acetyltransferase